MRGRMNAINAEMLAAELRKRLAETNNTIEPSANSPRGDSASLGSRAFNLAQVATAMHMTAAAVHLADSLDQQSSGGAR